MIVHEYKSASCVYIYITNWKFWYSRWKAT